MFKKYWKVELYFPIVGVRKTLQEEKGKYCIKQDKIKEIHCPSCKSPDFLEWEEDVQEISCTCEDNPHLYLAHFSCECGHRFLELRDDRY